MRRSLSWIEPQALAAALARAGVEGTQAPPRRSSAVGPRPAVRSTPEVLVPVPPEAEPTGTRSGDPFVLPEGNLAERLEAFCEWLTRQTGCKGIFIADQDGLPVLEKNTGEELVAASSLLARFLDLVHSRHPSVSDTGMALKLRTGDRIYFLQDRSESGRICLGFVAGSPVDGRMLERAQQALGSALAGGPPQRGPATEKRNPTPAEDR